MRAFTIAAIIAVLAVPANAQMGPGNGGGGISILGGDGGRGKLGKKSDEQIAAEQQRSTAIRCPGASAPPNAGLKFCIV